ncbi:MAG: DUF1700 domain-containing protein [Oscillospiraceae bacterium]|nr:DUF1700 domain-containing protein [Oscillospiraceae bacterium]
MNQEFFLQELRRHLFALPEAERERIVEDYRGMILDRMEDGATEEEAVAELGTPAEIAGQILSEIPITTLVRERVRPKRKIAAWEIVLLVLGAPLCLPLLIVAAAVALGLLLTSFSVVLAVVVAAGAAVYYGAPLFLYAEGNPLVIAGISIGCIGLGLLLLLAAFALAKRLGQALIRFVRRRILKRDGCEIKA